jgi:hypothetical protein
MRRSFWIMASVMCCWVARAQAGDVTQASAVLNTIATSANSWAYFAIIIGFVAVLAGIALSHFQSFQQTVGVPVHFIIIGGLVSSVLGILGATGIAQGAVPPTIPVEWWMAP